MTDDTTPEGPRWPEESLLAVLQYFEDQVATWTTATESGRGAQIATRVILDAIQAHEDLRTRYLTEKAQWQGELGNLKTRVASAIQVLTNG